MKYAFECENLFVNFGKNAVLWDVSFQIPKGDLLAIVGPNGAGKSTLLKAALNLVAPLSGKVDFFGKPLEESRSKIAYVPQRESVDWDFPITVMEVALMGRYHMLGSIRRLRKSDVEAALYALRLVGMELYQDRQIGELSGGQQQRLFLARALAQNPDLLLLDEPFSAIDLVTEKSLVALLRQLAKSGKTIIAVHHDLPTVPEYFDSALLLNTRLIACGAVKDVFNAENLQKTYGKSALFEDAINLSARVYD